MSNHTRIPVLLLTGFLGSGKTTLLNRLMRARPESRGKLAIVVNEFGDVGIDGDLLPSDMTRQVELPGGCICCVLNEDLDKTLLDLLDANDDLEMIVIETTGVAEPLPISWSLAREPLSERVRLLTVITVVDVTEFDNSRPLSVAVDAQVEYADILVLSKLDLLDTDAPPGSVTEALTTLNPTALRITGSPDEITSLIWRSVVDPELPDAQPRALSSAQPTHQTVTDHAKHGSHGFDTVSLSIKNLIDFEELTSELEELPANYVRIKGIARVVDESTGSAEPQWISFHRVGIRVSSEPFSGVSEPRMVALGPGIEKSRLAACLDAAVIPSDS